MNRKIIGGVVGGVGLILSLSSAANASNTNGYGTIKDVSATEGGAVLFSIDTSYYSTETKSRQVTARRDAPPACGAGQASRWAIDASTVTGHAMVTTLLWAMDHNRLISVTGTGKCSAASDTETVAAINVMDNG